MLSSREFFNEIVTYLRKIPEEKNKMLYYATYCFVLFTMSNQLGTNVLSNILVRGRKKGNHN